MFKRFALLVVGVLSLTACSTPTNNHQVSISKVPVIKTISIENGWEYVSAEQNLLDQQRERLLGRAKAGSLFGCPDNYICLYHWIDYQGGRWQVHPNYTNDNCWNLSGSEYTDGYNVNNTSASLVVNRYSPGNPTWLGFYDWVNCNASGTVWAYYASGIVLRNHLGETSPDAYHKFTSIMTSYTS